LIVDAHALVDGFAGHLDEARVAEETRRPMFLLLSATRTEDGGRR